jgi:ABC-type proline/glycine betaine transport system substrate-binding protein
VAVAASNVLAELGITLQVNDVGTAVWNNSLESNTAMMLGGAWQSTVDPDMTKSTSAPTPTVRAPTPTTTPWSTRIWMS